MPGYSDARDWMSQIGAMGIMGGQQQSLLWQMLSLMSQLGPAMGAGQGPTSFAARAMAPSLMGGMFGAPTTPLIGGAIAGMMAQGQAQTAAGWAFPDILGAGGGLAGRGLGPGAVGGMAQFMGGLAGGGTSLADISQITAAAGSSGAFRGITDVKEARVKLQEMVKTVTALSKELSATIEDVSTGMAQVRSMGYTSTAGQAGALRGLLSGSAASGIPLNQFAQFQAAMGQEGRIAMGIPLAAASGAAGRSMAQIGAALRSGSLSDEVLMNATGLGGQAGVVALAGQIQGVSAQQLNRAQNQFALAAFIDPATGKLKQDMVNQFMQGAMDPGQVMRMASQNINRVGGQAAWMGMQPQLMGQFQEMTGNMGGMGFAGMLMQRYGYDMDPTNPRNVAAYTRAIGRDPRNRQDIMFSQAAMEVQSRWGENQEMIAASERAANREREISRSINERMANASISGFIQHSVNSQLEAVSGPAGRALQAVVDSGTSMLLSAQAQVVAAPMSALDGRSVFAGVTVGAPVETARRDRSVIRAAKAALANTYDPEEREKLQKRIESGEQMVGLAQTEEVIRRRGGAQMLTENQERTLATFYGGMSEERQNKLLTVASGGKIRSIADLHGMDLLAAVAAGDIDAKLYAKEFVGPAPERPGEAWFEGDVTGDPTGAKGLAYRRWEQQVTSTAHDIKMAAGRKGTGEVRPGAGGPELTTYEQLQREAAGLGGAIFGARAGAVMGGMTSSWDRLKELTAYLGKQDQGAKLDLAAIGKDLKWSSEIQKAMFGEGAVSKDATVGEFNQFVLKTGAAAEALTSQQLLEGGWLSQESATAYGEAGSAKSKAARRFAGRMAGAHGLLEAGDREGALAASRSAITDITALRGREFTQAMGALAGAGVTTTNELKELQGFRESGGGIDAAEIAKYDPNWMKTLGLSEREVAGQRIYDKPIQEKLASFAADQIIPQGSATDAGRKAPLADQMAASLKEIAIDMKVVAGTAQGIQKVSLENTAGVLVVHPPKQEAVKDQ